LALTFTLETLDIGIKHESVIYVLPEQSHCGLRLRNQSKTDFISSSGTWVGLGQPIELELADPSRDVVRSFD
jgi:hypothetical protein